MSQQVQELIDKIKQDGIQQADQKAKEIEGQAQAKAQQIINEAENKAEQLIASAKEEIKKMEESTHMALRQASRDTILSLRKEIEAILTKIAKTETGEALTAESLAKLIEIVIKSSLEGIKEKGNIEVSLNAKDVQKLKSGFLSKLQKQIKNPIKLQTSEDIGSGFTISFDEGKSSFDFTDQSLADYLSTYLNEQVSELVQQSTKE